MIVHTWRTTAVASYTTSRIVLVPLLDIESSLIDFLFYHLRDVNQSPHTLDRKMRK